MSCPRYRPLIALWVGGDLAPRLARRVKTHVAGCAACRALAGRLLENVSALAALAEEAPDSEALRVVRHRVLARLVTEGGRSASARIRPATARLALRPLLAAALVAAAVAAAILLRHASPPRALSTAAARPTTPPAPAPSPPTPMPAIGAAPPQAPGRGTYPASPRPPQTYRRVREVAADQRRAAAEPIVIKVVTDDPEVVIYWLVDSKKG